MQALKALVILMGIAIVVIVAVIVVTLFQRMGSREAAPAGFGDIALPVPEGCVLAAAEAAEERLVLRLDGPAEQGCQQAVVLDLKSGKVLGRITATPGP
jgi:hypothetical protein